MQDDRRIKNKVRRSYLVSTVSIAMVLFLLGAAAYAIVTAFDVSDRLRESLSVQVMLDRNADRASALAIESRLKSLEGVNQVTFLLRETAAQEFIRDTGNDFTEFLEFNPIPDSYEVRFSAAGDYKAELAKFEKEVTAWPEVAEVIYHKNFVEKMSANLGKLNLVVLFFGGILLIISLILLNNTIRVSIFSKRYIISTMKLVGATKWFVMKPFLRTAILQGIYSALIASVLLLALIAGLKEGLPELNFVTGNFYYLCIVAGMFMVGILISLIFTIFAVNKFIRMHSDAVHFY